MPRIQAPTVAEHHRMRRAALVRAAAALLEEHGVEGVTLAAVGASVGLARSSVYQYFDSTGALIGAVVEAELPRATAELVAAVQRAGTPAEKVQAWVSAYVSAATDHAHRSIADLGGLRLPEPSQRRIDELHADQAAPLVAALGELGIADPALVAALIGGMVRAAAVRINAGDPVERVAPRTQALVAAIVG